MKLALGTAQFGMKYGISNFKTKFSLEEIAETLEIAELHGIDTLDTAINYGESEKKLGIVGVKKWKVITKIHSSEFDQEDPYGWTKKQLEISLINLNVDTLEAVLLHDSTLLKENNGNLIWKALDDLKQEGLVKNLGVSIYSPSELDELYDDFSFDIIQSPFNVFDRRIDSTGWLETINKDNKSLHVRSVFLQGLLLVDPASRPEQFNKWANLWLQWENWLSSNNLKPLEACLNSIYERPGIDRFIVGIDSVQHLKEIISIILLKNSIELPSELDCKDENLINPSNWE